MQSADGDLPLAFLPLLLRARLPEAKRALEAMLSVELGTLNLRVLLLISVDSVIGGCERYVGSDSGEILLAEH